MTKISVSNFWKINNRLAFTLMELMIVVTVVGIVAAFAIPSYQKAVDRAYERQGRIGLRLIAGAQEAYKARYGNYWPVPLSGNHGISEMNPALKLNIVEPVGINIACHSLSNTQFQCYWERFEGSLKWQLYTNEVLSTGGNIGVPEGICCDKLYPLLPCPTVAICP